MHSQSDQTELSSLIIARFSLLIHSPFISRQENPEHQVHLMTVAPFIVDTGMIQGSIIRFPGQLFKRNLHFLHCHPHDIIASILFANYFMLGLINLVSSKRAAQIIIANMRRREVVVFIPGIYYYIMVSCLFSWQISSREVLDSDLT